MISYEFGHSLWSVNASCQRKRLSCCSNESLKSDLLLLQFYDNKNYTIIDNTRVKTIFLTDDCRFKYPGGENVASSTTTSRWNLNYRRQGWTEGLYGARQCRRIKSDTEALFPLHFPRSSTVKKVEARVHRVGCVPFGKSRVRRRR